MAPIHGPEGPASGSAKRDELRETGDLHEKVWELERRLDKQAATLQALFALFSGKAGVAGAPTAAELIEEVHRVEQQRTQTAPKACAKCGHAMGRRQMSCVYCGQPRVVESPFELL